MVVMAHILVNWDWKTIIIVGMVIVLVYGIFIGPKGKGQNTKHYDQKEKNQIKHHLRAAESGKDYVFKGSGKYKDSSGGVHKDK